MTRVHKIVLTGGPCGGKTMGLGKVRQKLEKSGYRVYIVEETATQLILSGIAPGEDELDYFQKPHLSLQKHREKIYETAAEKQQGAKGSVVIYDRLLKIWSEHPYVKVIDNSTDFEGKLERLTAAILNYIEEKERG